MATPVPTLVGSVNEVSSDGSISIPNTTPPVVGDLLVVFIGAYASGASRTIGATPSGWTSQASTSGDEEVCAVYTKVADAGDVSAGNFGPFAISSTADVFSGVAVKVSNKATGQEIAGAEADTLDPSGSTFTFTTNLTPTTPESLLLAMYMGSDGGGTAPSIGSYASTPSLSWSELIELQGDNGNPVMTFSVAHAAVSGLTTITERTATGSATFADGRDGIAILINGYKDAAGTAALLSADADFFAPTASSGTSGTALLLLADTDFFSESSSATSPTTWQHETKSTTSWTNEPQT